MWKILPIGALVALVAGCGLQHHGAAAEAGQLPSASRVIASPSPSSSPGVDALTCRQIETYPKIDTVPGLQAFVTFLRQRVTRPGLAPSLSAQLGRLLTNMIADTGSPLTTPRDIEVQRNALAPACSRYGVSD